VTTAVLRRGMPDRAAVVVLALLAALGLVVATPGRALAGPGEGDFFSAVNAARSAAGVHPVVWADDLAAVARRQAERMARAGELFHNPNLGGEVSGWQVVSENVGYGPTWNAIQDAFMASPEHRANLLDPEVTQLGVGTVVGPDGRLWVSQVFRLPYGASPPSPAASGAGSGSGSGPTTGSGTVTTSGTYVPAPQPSPEQLLRQRLASAREKVSGHPGRTADPLVAALDFSTVMATVGS
jgi:Cysteine-rich secretory protein family